MTEKLRTLLKKAMSLKMSPDQKEEQRRSFAFGNTSIENPRITRKMVDEQSAELKKKASA